MLRRIFNRNNLINTNYIHLHKSNTEMLCPFFIFFFHTGLSQVLRGRKKTTNEELPSFVDLLVPVRLCSCAPSPLISFLWEGKRPLCSPSHWFSGCLVFSCLGISEVKKRPMALEPVGVCAGGERQQNPALFLSIF